MAGNSDHSVTTVERKSRYVVIAKVPDKRASRMNESKTRTVEL